MAINNSLFNQINFCIRRAMTDTMALHWEMFPRTIFDHELLFVEAGNMSVTIDGIVYEAIPGDLILFPPNVIHSLKTHGPVRLTQPHIHFDFEYRTDFPEVYVSFEVIKSEHPDARLFRENYWKKLGLPYHIRPSLPLVSDRIHELIFTIIKLQLVADFSALFSMKHAMSQILLLLMEETGNMRSEGQETRYERIYEITNLFLERQMNTRFDLDEIAQSIGYTKNYISHLYRRHFGITPAKQYEILKLNRAKEYLRQQNITITEISDTLGYPSINDFSRAFKRAEGISPSLYRKNFPL